jgi:hypothetical protein
MPPGTSKPRNLKTITRVLDIESSNQHHSKNPSKHLDNHFSNGQTNVQASINGCLKAPSTTLQSWLDDDEDHFVNRMARHSTMPIRTKPRKRTTSETNSAQMRSENDKSAVSNNVNPTNQRVYYSQGACLLHVGAWCNEPRFQSRLV